ncbi:MAG: peptide chain release factor N(5)-glutamine methyltransferase [Spirochaetaceae bacterium]|jgi:release factor glutamine methyltransferase|nr:peptide chain release factor N(5)-glutamine methyltransferase [Spirochaetaceae bacterium]
MAGITAGEALKAGAALLRSAGIDTPFLDASLLLGEILRLDRAGLILAEGTPLSPETRSLFDQSLKRRLSGECVAWILGRREFRGLDFIVGPQVLVPRPDTETLVEAALEFIDLRGAKFPEGGLLAPLSVLEIGTGSGAVAVSLKAERPALMVSASDISPPALDLARSNAQRLLGKADGVNFISGSLFDGIAGFFDLVLSNPPYVPTALLETLAPEVRREPRIALDGGSDGLDLIRPIIAGAPEHLRPGGMLLLEADPGQMPAIAALLTRQGYRNIRVFQDLSGRDRVIGGIPSGGPRQKNAVTGIL